MVETGKSAGAIVDERGLSQVTDTGAIEAAIDACWRRSRQGRGIPRRQGQDFGFFVGQVMKATDGKANPALLNELLSKKLAG